MKKLTEFMANEKVSFETLIRCFNFWDRLNPREKAAYVDAYAAGKVPNSGPYGPVVIRKKRTRKTPTTSERTTTSNGRKK